MGTLLGEGARQVNSFPWLFAGPAVVVVLHDPDGHEGWQGDTRVVAFVSADVEAEMAGAISMMGLMNIIGSLVSGLLTQRFDNRKLLAIYYGFRALSRHRFDYLVADELILAFRHLDG